MRERAGCEWFSEALMQARERFPDAARFHASHSDDLSACDAWVCVCQKTDPHGGSWDTCTSTGYPVEPTGHWTGTVKCLECGRIFDSDGYVIDTLRRSEE